MIMNKDVWKDLMKFPFTEEEIKKRLKSSYPKVPAYFNRESVTPAVIDWFNNTWFPRTDEQKLKSLKEFAMYPERVFFILIEEAYLKRKKGDHISNRLVDEGFDMMDKVVQEKNESKPQSIPETEELPVGTGKFTEPPEEDTEEEEKGDKKETPTEKIKRTKKQYGMGISQKKVKQPGRIKKPSTVQPAIK